MSSRKSYLVSGAGSGIGQAICIKLANQGHRVIGLGRTEQTLKETLDKLDGTDHEFVKADIGNADALKQALSQADLSHLHGLVANAGIGGENYYGADDRWHEVIRTNLTGSYHFIQEGLVYLKSQENDFRHIVIVSSILARLGVPGYSAYCSSKAGLLGLMRSLAVELASQKILVNALCPGWVDTAMARQGIDLMAQGQNKSFDQVRKEQMSQVLLGKMSSPEEIANLVSWLMSSNQNSITGQTIDINNGALMP